MLKATEILRAMHVSPPNCPKAPVYAIVPKNGPVSFYSQQKRAFNLVSALRQEEELPPGAKVGVIVAGLAGVTASAAAHMLGCNVKLFEANEAKFHQQHGNHTRYIHPNAIDWPSRGSDSPGTNLPFLNWAAGNCASVIDDIEDQWRALRIKMGDPAFYRVSKFETDGAYISAQDPFFEEKFKVVIIAVGFGAEAKFGLDQKSYWSDEDWGQLLSTDRKTIFVSGTGDGGLIDAMRLALLNFDHGNVLEQVMIYPRLLEIRQELIDVDYEVRSLLDPGSAPISKEWLNSRRAEGSRLLYLRYKELGVAERMPAMPIRKNYNKLILNSPLPTPLNANSSIVNRVIVHWLISKGAIAYASGDLMKFPDGKFRGNVSLNRSPSPDKYDIETLSDIDHVIIRHGPLGALRSVLSEEEAESYLNHSHEVDQVGQEERWRSVQYKVPADFKPTREIALNRAMRLQRAFERWISERGIVHRSILIGMTPDGKYPAYTVDVDEENKKKLDEEESLYHGIRIISKTEPNKDVPILEELPISTRERIAKLDITHREVQAYRLAADALRVLEEDPTQLELSALLAAEGMRRCNLLACDRALRGSLTLLPKPLFAISQKARALAFRLLTAEWYVFTVSEDGVAEVREILSRRVRAIQCDAPSKADFSLDGSLLAAVAKSGIWQLVDTKSGERVSELLIPGDPLSITFVTSGACYVVTADSESTVKIYNLTACCQVAALRHDQTVTSARVSPDGRHIVTLDRDGVSRIFKAKNGREPTQISEKTFDAIMPIFSPDGDYLAAPGGISWETGAIEGSVRIFDLRTNDLVHEFASGQGIVKALAYSSAGNHLATGDEGGFLRVLQTNGAEVGSLRLAGPVTTVRFSPGDRYVIAESQDRTARAFDFRLRREVARWTNGDHDVQVDESQWCAATLSKTGEARFWIFHSGRERFAGFFWGIVARATISSGGGYLAASESNGGVRVIDLGGLIESGRRDEIITRAAREHGVLMASAFSLDARRVAFAESGRGFNELRVFEMSTRSELFCLDQKDGVSALAFHPDGRQLAIAKGRRTVVLLDLGTKAEVLAAVPATPGAISFSPDGEFLATAGNGSVAMFKSSHTLDEVWSCKESLGPAPALRFRPDGQQLAVADDDGLVSIRQANDGAEVRRLSLKGRAHALAFTADGGRFAVGTSEGEIRIFSTTDWSELSQISHPGDIHALEFDNTARCLFAAMVVMGQVCVATHFVTPEALINEACAHLTRNLTEPEWVQYIGHNEPYHPTCSLTQGAFPSDLK